jgi:hypothetical protein
MGTAFLAFTLDRWRVPTLLGIVALLGLLHLLRWDPVDHQFATRPLAEAGQQVTPATPHEILFGPGSPDMPIVVTAEGGGIHSGVWACHVLATLEMMCRTGEGLEGRSLRNEIVCASGVSGGSYGLLYWLESYTNEGLKRLAAGNDHEAYAKEMFRLTRGRAMRTSLEFAIRGMVYHDTRVFSFLQQNHIATDRGHMLETAWARDLLRQPGKPTLPHSSGLWLSDWTADAKARRRPVALFNSTSEERGLPVIFATSSLGDLHKPHPLHYHRWCRDSSDQRLDVPVTAAVRCSASFPYVVPAARPRAVDCTAKAQHLLDGGYYDNTGVMGMVHWLRDALALPTHLAPDTHPPRLQEKTIIVIRILEADAASPDAVASSREQNQEGVFASQQNAADTGIRKGIIHQLTSPISAVLSVRSKGHREEATNALVALEREARQVGVKVKHFDFVYPHPAQPLSWHLTRPQMDEIARVRLDGRIADDKPSFPLHDLSTEVWVDNSGATSTEDVRDVWSPTNAGLHPTQTKLGHLRLHTENLFAQMKGATAKPIPVSK